MTIPGNWQWEIWSMSPTFGKSSWEIRMNTKASLYRDGKKVGEIALHLGAVEPSQKEILAAGCLINYYAGSKK